MQRPASATHGIAAAAGFVGIVAATLYCVFFDPFGRDAVSSSAFIIAVAAASIAFVDLIFQKVHRRIETGLDFSSDAPSWPRTLVKLLGLLASVGFIALFYWLVPIYGDAFYQPFFGLMETVWIYWVLAAVPYFRFVDRRMRDPRDGYWRLGRLLLGQWQDADRRVLLQHLLGWLVKGFFLPLMFCWFCRDLNTLWQARGAEFGLYLQWHNLAYIALYMLEVGLACVGYVFSLRLLDSHMRSVDASLLGWVAALLCYEPFWTLFLAQFFLSWNDFNWVILFQGSPAMMAVWSAFILAFTAIYVWATVMFGLRFSNLTHRGIITNGPYRFSKHPAYVAKGVTWWLVAVPFFADAPIGTVLSNCAVLLALCALYLLRAKTEEWHLRRDPTYAEYARWIDAHGLLRVLRNVPGLRFKAMDRATAA